MLSVAWGGGGGGVWVVEMQSLFYMSIVALSIRVAQKGDISPQTHLQPA